MAGASGCTGGGDCIVSWSRPGASSSFEFSASSQVIILPDSAAMADQPGRPPGAEGLGCGDGAAPAAPTRAMGMVTWPAPA